MNGVVTYAHTQTDSGRSNHHLIYGSGNRVTIIRTRPSRYYLRITVNA